MQTGENHEALRKIFDFIRLGSIIVLLIHFYTSCHSLATVYHLTWTFTDKLVSNIIVGLPVLRNIYSGKLLSIALLMIAVAGSKGRKSKEQSPVFVATLLIFGLIIYFGSAVFLDLSANTSGSSILYLISTSLGYCAFFKWYNTIDTLIEY